MKESHWNEGAIPRDYILTVTTKTNVRTLTLIKVSRSRSASTPYEKRAFSESKLFMIMVASTVVGSVMQFLSLTQHECSILDDLQ